MDLISSSITTHIYAVSLMFVIMCINFYVVTRTENFMLLAKRLRIATPIFHALNFIAFYTGAIIVAFVWNNNQDSILYIKPTVILMVLLSIFLMVLEIKRYKKMRIIKLKEYDKQTEFKTFAKKIYIIQIVTILVFGLIFELYAGII